MGFGKILGGIGGAIGGPWGQIIGTGLGMGAGALLGGGKKNVVTTQQQAPWRGQQPFLRRNYRDAMRLPLQQYYPGQTYADQSPETLQALDLQSQRAMSGSPLQFMGQGQLAGTLGGQYLGAQPGAGYLQPFTQQNMDFAGVPQLQDTASGNYLYGGPGFNAAFDAARRQITPAVQGQFESAGRFGGGLAQEAETSALSDAFAGLYGQERQRQLAAAGQLSGLGAQERARAQAAAGQLSGQAADLYGQERQRQVAGLGFVPEMSGLDYRDISALSDVGRQREMFDQQRISDQLNRWQFAQQAPYDRLAAQTSVIQGGFPGSSSVTQQPVYGNRLAGALGGAFLANSIYNNWPAVPPPPPTGTPITPVGPQTGFGSAGFRLPPMFGMQ